MINVFKLRIDTSPCDGVQQLCDKYAKEYLYTYENTGEENPHVHMYLQLSKQSRTVRAYIRKVFGSGNGVYSLKELDEQYPIEYLAYCMKLGEPTHNLPNEIIDKAKSYDLDVKRSMKEKKSSRRTQLQILDDIIGTECELQGDVYVRSNGLIPCKEFVVDTVIRYYKDEKKLVREFMIVSLVQSLCLKYVPSYDYELKRKILDRI